MRAMIRAAFAAAVAVGVAFQLTPSPALADETEAQLPVVVVADFSGSMNAADADAQGTTRVAAAKAAVRGLLDSSPEGARLGLVVFGTTSDSCQDIHTLNPVGPFDAAALGERVDSLEAVGNTPIGPALLHAAEELAGVEGPRTIILVSDGEPNCEPPPACDVARGLAAQGIDMAIHTIGFRVSDNPVAREVLQCIASVTDGEYTDVENADDLKDVLETETLRAMRTYESAGERVDGGAVEAEAAGLIAGQYVTSMPSGELADPSAGDAAQRNLRWFAVPRQEGWETTVSATLVEPPFEGTAPDGIRDIRMRLSSSAEGCHAFVEANDSDPGLTAAPHPTAVLRIGTDERLANCVNDAGEYVFAVSRFGPAWAEQSLDVELKVAYQRFTDDVEVTDPTVDPMPVPEASSPVALPGGTSFNRAARLTGGRTITDTIVPGERVFYEIPAGYGQTIQARLDFPESMPDGGWVQLTAFNPVRDALQFSSEQDGTAIGDSVLTQTPQAGSFVTGYLDRGFAPGHRLAPEPFRGHAVPGVQYLVVARSWDPAVAGQELPFSLTAVMVGDEVEGGIELVQTAHEYAVAFPPDPEPTPTPSPTEPTAGTTTPSPTAEPTSSETATEPADDEAPAEPGGGFLWALVLGGAGGVLVLAGVGWWVLRRRR